MQKAFKFFDMVKEFPGFKLGPLNFELEPGMVLGYVGPNGSGKTTTMHCLVGLLRPDSGEMKIFGTKNDPNDPSWKFDIGYVGDKHVFYENWTGEKNLKFLSQFYPNWSDNFAMDLAKRFEVPLDKRAKDLSSGNRVKLSLIGALAHSPKLLILDEPTAGLDPVVRTEVLDVLFEVVESGERAIFYSTHILSDISRIVDEIAFIKEGNISLRKPKEELIQNWRKISFKIQNEFNVDTNILILQQEGENYKIISSDASKTFEQLKEIGAKNISETGMSIEEIAVQILKDKNNVQTS